MYYATNFFEESNILELWNVKGKQCSELNILLWKTWNRILKHRAWKTGLWCFKRKQRFSYCCSSDRTEFSTGRSKFFFEVLSYRCQLPGLKNEMWLIKNQHQWVNLIESVSSMSWEVWEKDEFPLDWLSDWVMPQLHCRSQDLRDAQAAG